MIGAAAAAVTEKLKRCPNGSRRNKITKECDPITRNRIKTQRRSPPKSSLSTSRRKTVKVSPAKPVKPFIEKTPKRKIKHVKVPPHLKAFFKQGPVNTQMRFLQAICSKSHYCTAFGRETDRIDKFFDFNTFAYLSKVALLTQGGNGAVHELIFERNKMKASTVLKTSIYKSRSIPDNIYVEGYNGLKYINKFALQFPCFIKTHGIFSFNSTIRPQLYGAEKIYTTASNEFKNAFKPVKVDTYDAAFSCTSNYNTAILLEHLHDPTTLSDFINSANNAPIPLHMVYCNVYIPTILFQIYAVLNSLTDVFAHNDLHLNNILLYEIPDDKHIIMRYKNAVNGETVEFPTRYIVKIIDYGRCYLPENAAIYKKVCKTIQCGYDCGYDYGYGEITWNPDKALLEKYHITQQKYNPSKDIMTAYNTMRYMPPQSVISNILQRLVSDNYGALPAKTTHIPSDYDFNSLNIKPVEIKNVEELYWALFYFVKRFAFAYVMDEVVNAIGPRYGTMTIDLNYSNDHVRPLEFVVG